jgi:GT2 family glycosyltransferase
MPERETTPSRGRVTTLAARPAQTAPELSVCIVNWNCAEVLRDCLRSLQSGQSGLRYEIIVVDNGSTDGAAEMVAREFPRVRIWRNAGNVGFARANNQAAALARGRYLFFLNNDTVVPPGTLRRMRDFLRSHPDVVMVGPCLRDAQGKLQMSHRRAPTPRTFLHRTMLFRRLRVGREEYQQYRRAQQGNEAIHDVDILMGAAIAMPRQPFLSLGGWDEDFTFGGEDMELCHRARRIGRVVYWPALAITHLGSISSKRHVGFVSTHTAIGFAKYFRKTGASRLDLWLYKLAITIDAPIRLGWRALQYAWRGWRPRERKTQRCVREMRGAWSFLLRGLVAFWRA